MAPFDEDLRRGFAGLRDALLPQVSMADLGAIRRRRTRRRVRQAAVALAVAAAAGLAATRLPAVFGDRVPPVAPGPTVTVPTVTAPSAPMYDPVLDGSGLRGIAAFGDPMDPALARLRTALGAPDEDWVPQTSEQENFGVCPGQHHRYVRWGRLAALFTDGRTRYAPAGRWHLFAWYAKVGYDVGPVEPETAAGVRVGTTVTELRHAYGSRVRIVAQSEPPGDHFVVGGGGAAITGTLTSTGQTGRVTQLWAGDACGE